MLQNNYLRGNDQQTDYSDSHDFFNHIPYTSKKSTLYLVQCASGRSSHPQTWRRRCSCRQCHCGWWSHHPGTWTVGWRGGMYFPCNQSLYHQCTEHGSSLKKKKIKKIKTKIERKKKGNLSHFSISLRFSTNISNFTYHPSLPTSNFWILLSCCSHHQHKTMCASTGCVYHHLQSRH